MEKLKGISVYVGLDDYPIEETLKYLEQPIAFPI